MVRMRSPGRFLRRHGRLTLAVLAGMLIVVALTAIRTGDSTTIVASACEGVG